jgi:hypothetical protein
LHEQLQRHRSIHTDIEDQDPHAVGTDLDDYEDPDPFAAQLEEDDDPFGNDMEPPYSLSTAVCDPTITQLFDGSQHPLRRAHQQSELMFEARVTPQVVLSHLPVRSWRMYFASLTVMI